MVLKSKRMAVTNIEFVAIQGIKKAAKQWHCIEFSLRAEIPTKAVMAQVLSVKLVSLSENEQLSRF
jgi:hypothetical protein